MIITILDGRKKPVDCDLSQAKTLTRVKSYTTRKINQQNSGALEAMLEQLKKYKLEKPKAFKKDVTANILLKRVSENLQKIQLKPEIRIKTLRKSYDINDPADLKNLQKRIINYCKHKRIETIESIQKQITELQKTHKNNEALNKLLVLVDASLTRLRAKDTYKTYNTVLEPEFKLKKREKNSVQLQGVIADGAIGKYDDDSIMRAYLNRPVTSKKKLGQDNVGEISACFWLDFLNNKNSFFDAANDREKVILYLVVIKNFFSHNASYYPAQGYGKSTEEECKQTLFYARSQSKHHETSSFAQELGGGACYGRQNSAYLKMVRRCTAITREYRKSIENIDINGKPKETTKNEHYGEVLAHLGSRTNNVELNQVVMADAYDASSTDNHKELGRLILKPDKLTHWNKRRTANTIKEALGAFKKLQKNTQLSFHTKVQSNLMSQRSQQAKQIVTTCDALQLKKIVVSTPTDSTLIYIDLYPELLDDDYKNSQNIKEGLTNVLLGFFGGLINKNAIERNLHYVLQRRQSFGFLRATLTDAGSLRIRLSLDVNPSPFTQLIIDSIKQFDSLNNDYNFVSPKSSKTEKHKKLVHSILKVCEAKRGQQETNKTGTYCLNAMRNEDDQWIALLVSQKYLELGDIDSAFQKYLNEFIIDRVEHKKIAESDHKSILHNGYSFSRLNTIDKKKNTSINTEEIIESNPLFIILENLIGTVINYVMSLSNISTSISSAYVLVKLLHNCQKGKAILEHACELDRLSHYQAKAELVIENLQEYLIPLRLLANDTNCAITDLSALDQDRFARALNVKNENVQLFYNDSGTQAINTALMAMTMEGMQTFHLFKGSYHEVNAFIKDTGLTIKPKEEASVWFCDITHIDELSKTIKLTSKSNLKALVIDITHNSSSEKLSTLANIVEQARKSGIWIILSCSTLKHEQLGQDKYQSGRNIILAPDGKELNERTTKKYLSNISEAAMNPLVASFRQTIETITCEGNSGALAQYGIYKIDQVAPLGEPESCNNQSSQLQ